MTLLTNDLVFLTKKLQEKKDGGGGGAGGIDTYIPKGEHKFKGHGKQMQCMMLGS